MEHRHPPIDPKSKPCADMTLTTSLLSSVNDNSSTITVSFDEMIDVSKEVIAFTFFQMVAEVKVYTEVQKKENVTPDTMNSQFFLKLMTPRACSN